MKNHKILNNTQVAQSNVPQVFGTNNPGLLIILIGVHKLPIVGTMEASHFKSRYFIFEETDKLKGYIDLWNEVSKVKSNGYETIYHYIYNTLDKKMQSELSSLVNELNSNEN